MTDKPQTPRTDKLEAGIKVRASRRGFNMPEDYRDAMEIARRLERELAETQADVMDADAKNTRLMKELSAARESLREAAEIAGREWYTFSQTKQAHERNSPEPFCLQDFGFNYDKVMYSKECMTRIRELEQAEQSSKKASAPQVPAMATSGGKGQGEVSPAHALDEPLCKGPCAANPAECDDQKAAVSSAGLSETPAERGAAAATVFQPLPLPPQPETRMTTTLTSEQNSAAYVLVPRNEVLWMIEQYDDQRPSFEMGGRLYEVVSTLKKYLAAPQIAAPAEAASALTSRVDYLMNQLVVRDWSEAEWQELHAIAILSLSGRDAMKAQT